MQTIINFLQEVLVWVVALFKTMIVTVVTLLEDLVCWVCDEVLSAVKYLIGLIDVSFLNSLSLPDAVAMLPAQILNVMWLLGVPQALGLILAALTVRFFLQLIPFARLGS